MDENSGISVVEVKLQPSDVPGASSGTQWLLADVLVQFEGPHQGMTIHVSIPDTGKPELNEKMAIVEAQRLARFFGGDRSLSDPSSH